MLSLTVDIGKIVENYRAVERLCTAHGMSLVVVAKLCLTSLDIVKPLIDAGARTIAETDLVNLESLPYHVKRMLLRLSLGDVRRGLEHCDFALLSEPALYDALASDKRGRKVKVLVSVESGDLREGVAEAELPAFLGRLSPTARGPRIEGFAANYGCLRGFVPTHEDTLRLREACDKAAAKVGLDRAILSLGGTTIYDLLADGSLDGIADQIRMGEAIFFGYNMSLGKKIPGLHDDALILTGEVIESRDKTVPDDEAIGYNAFGHKTERPPSGIRRRAVLNFGERAAPTRSLEPLLPGARFAGATHDYAVLDVTDCDTPPRAGDVVSFRTNYCSAAQAMLSPYVEKRMAGQGSEAVEVRP